MVVKAYTKRDISIIKGFAILCIVFHNYFHWLSPSPGENEFNFSPSIIDRLGELLGMFPGEFVNLLFSYFGHFGVQLFLMVSGYGLVMAMMNRPRPWSSFVLHRLKKLYPLLLTALVFYILSMVVMESRLPATWEWKQIGYKLLLIHTLIPNFGLSLCGPWWFFGLIFQLYLLFPLLYHSMRKWGWKAFWVVMALAYGMIFLFREYVHLYHGELLMQNAPGHLPEFCFGMMLAFSKDQKIHWGWLLLALVLFVWGNFAPGFYPFTFLSLCVITAFVTQALKPLLKKTLKTRLSVLNYLGTISMLLFAVHGFLRTPVLTMANGWHGGWWHCCSGLIYFLIVWAVALAAKPMYEKMVSLLNGGLKKTVNLQDKKK